MGKGSNVNKQMRARALAEKKKRAQKGGGGGAKGMANRSAGSDQEAIKAAKAAERAAVKARKAAKQAAKGGKAGGDKNPGKSKKGQSRINPHTGKRDPNWNK